MYAAIVGRHCGCAEQFSEFELGRRSECRRRIAYTLRTLFDPSRVSLELRRYGRSLLVCASFSLRINIFELLAWKKGASGSRRRRREEKLRVKMVAGMSSSQ